MIAFESPRPVAATDARIVGHLLGGIDVRVDGLRIDTRLPPASLTVLAFLLVHAGETLRRDDVAFELWPDATESDAKATLRRNLYILQQSMPDPTTPFVRCDKRTIECPNADIAWIDVARFEPSSERPESLEEAAELYRGDFAPRLEHEWAIALREYLRNRSVRVLEALLARYGERDDDRAILRYGQRLLEIDPWREDVLCRTMVARFRLGDRAGAVRSYGAFRANLIRELGVEPMPETRARFEAIRAS